MSLYARLANVVCLIIIAIIFLAFGYDSVSKVKIAKVDPKTQFLSNMIDSGQSLSDLSDQLYKLLSNTEVLESNKKLKICDDTGEETEMTARDVVYREIENIYDKACKEKSKIEKLEDNEYAENYQESLDNYDNAGDIMCSTCEEIIDNCDENTISEEIINKASVFITSIGKNGDIIKYYVNKARKGLKK